MHPLPQPHATYAQAFATSSLQPPHWPAPSESILSRSTTALIRAIDAGDLPAIYRILFPATHRAAILVNRLDSQGWAPLHYCVSSSHLSVEIVDALFLAGADTSLYTSSKHGTPLHCLARHAQEPESPLQAARVHVFIHHLVRELRAPLSATDEEGETCIHVAAEHGGSVEVLLALLACDTRSAVRGMKNSRGCVTSVALFMGSSVADQVRRLTALEVARPELRIAFGAEAEPRRSSSVASFRTIRPSTASSTSTSSYASSMTTPSRRQLGSTARLEPPAEAVDTSLLPRRILENLAMVGQVAPSADVIGLRELRDVLDETSHLGELWAHSMHTRIQEAAQDLRDARSRLNGVDNLLETVTQDLEAVFGSAFTSRKDSTDRARRRTTDSADSDLTAVSSRASSSLSRKWRSMSDLRSSRDSTRPEIPYLTIAEEEEPALPVERPSVDKSSFLNALLSPTVNDLLHKPSKLSIDIVRTASPASSKKDGSSSGTAKLKAWFRKKLRFEIPELSIESKIVLPGEQSPRRSPLTPCGDRSSSPDLLRTARQMVRVAGQDLSGIECCMDEVCSLDDPLSLFAHFPPGGPIPLLCKQITVPNRTTLQNGYPCELHRSDALMFI